MLQTQKKDKNHYNGEYAQLMVKRKITSYIDCVNQFCNSVNIKPSIQNMLFYKSNFCGVGPNWALACDAPIILKAYSKTFDNYRKCLDPDFCRDFVNEEDLLKARVSLQRTPELLQWLSELLATDMLTKNIMEIK